MQNFFYVKDRGEFVQLLFSDVHYIEAERRYVKFVTADKYYLTESSICNIESILPADQFCRIHRSFIVSLRHTQRFNTSTVTVPNKQLPIGKEYKDVFKKKIILATSERRFPDSEPGLQGRPAL